MTNYEFYKDEILKMCKEGDGVRVFALANPNKLYKHNGNPCCSCSCELLEWLYSEHIEKPKLTKQERKFCELLEGKDCWFVRDSDETLCLFVDKPYKEDDEDMWWADKTGAAIMTGDDLSIFEVKMLFIKWEDEEPWHINELLTLEVEE